MFVFVSLAFFFICFFFGQNPFCFVFVCLFSGLYFILCHLNNIARLLNYIIYIKSRLLYDLDSNFLF